MRKLPIVSGKEMVKVLTKIGYSVHYQKGSHIHLKRLIHPYDRIVVPNHKELRKGTLRGILKDAGLKVEDFIRLLR